MENTFEGFETDKSIFKDPACFSENFSGIKKKLKS